RREEARDDGAPEPGRGAVDGAERDEAERQREGQRDHGHREAGQQVRHGVREGLADVLAQGSEEGAARGLRRGGSPGPRISLGDVNLRGKPKGPFDDRETTKGGSGGEAP